MSDHDEHARRSPASAADWLDDRLGSANFVKRNARKVFPDHWSFMLGEIALYSFIILLLTGTFLTLCFNPSMRGGVRRLLRPAAGAADVRGLRLDAGHLLRRPRRPAHAADPPLGGADLRRRDGRAHVRVFFTGAFRKPREINWIIGVVLLTLGFIEGFAGYSLPDDLLSGTGLRITAGRAAVAPGRRHLRCRSSCSAASSRARTSSRGCSPCTSC